MSTPDLSDDLAHEFVSFALSRPAQFGPENFAGDPLVEQFVDVVLRTFSLDVRMYVSWECPPNVTIVGLPTGNALLRSERLDTLLVEFYRLRQVQPLFDGPLAQDVAQAQVLRWMCEFLIGYRHSPLALDALELRPALPGLELGIWNPFRDETLSSIPALPKVALQCFSLGHELGHLVRSVEPGAGLDSQVDGMPVMSHLDYDFRASNPTSVALDRFREYCTQAVNAPQLLTEIKADLFGLDCVAEFLCRTHSCTPETAVSVALSACEALIFLYHCKEICRLLARVASGDLERGTYEKLRFVDGLNWAARSRGVGRRAGITLTSLEGGTAADLNRNVDRIDAIILGTGGARRQLADAMDACEQSLLRHAERRSRGGPDRAEVGRRLEGRPELRLELYYLLIAFGCHGSVDVVTYLMSAGETAHHVSS